MRVSALEQALAEFGLDMGVSSLSPGPSGAVQLRFDHGAMLGFFRKGDYVVLYWAEPVLYDTSSVLLRAFKRVGDPSPGEPAVQVGLSSIGDDVSLVLATRMLEQDCSASALHELTSWLRQYVAALRD